MKETTRNILDNILSTLLVAVMLFMTALIIIKLSSEISDTKPNTVYIQPLREKCESRGGRYDLQTWRDGWAESCNFTSSWKPYNLSE